MEQLLRAAQGEDDPTEEKIAAMEVSLAPPSANFF